MLSLARVYMTFSPSIRAGQVAQHTPCPITIIPPEDRS